MSEQTKIVRVFNKIVLKKQTHHISLWFKSKIFYIESDLMAQSFLISLHGLFHSSILMAHLIVVCNGVIAEMNNKKVTALN